MFSRIIFVSFLVVLVLAEQDLRVDTGEKQQDTVVRRTVNKNIVDCTEKVQQSQPIWQQYKPWVILTRDTEGGIKKVVRLPGNPFFGGIRVHVKPYPGGYVAVKTNEAEIVKPITATVDPLVQDQEIVIEPQTQVEQQQLLQQQQREHQLEPEYQQYKRSTLFHNPEQKYLTRYPVWSRFLQPQYQRKQEFNEYRPYMQQRFDDIYGQTRGEDKIIGGNLQELKQKAVQEDLYNPYRVPLFQQHQLVPYQVYVTDTLDEQQQLQVPYYQQGPYTNSLVNRFLGYQQHPWFQQQQQYQPFNLPVHTI